MKLHTALVVLGPLLGAAGMLYAQVDDGPLPADEFEARSMIRAGTLDSADFERYRFLYSEPLTVPLGELKRLVEVFAEASTIEYPDSLALAGYEPWGREDIGRFLADYPDLVRYRPVLVFERTTRSVGSISLRGRVSPWFGTGVHGRLSLFPVQSLRMNAGFAATDTTLLLSSRQFSGKLGAHLRYNLGGYSPAFDNGLVLGAFGRKPVLDATDFWRPFVFGNGGTYNGLRVVASAPRESGGELYLHAGPSSCAATLWIRSPQIHALASGLGVTVADTVNFEQWRPPVSPVFQSGLEYHAGRTRGILRSATARDGVTALSLYVGWRDSVSALSVFGAWLPRRFPSSLSRYRAEFERLIGPDASGKNGVLNEWDMELKPLSHLRLTPFCVAGFTPSVSAARAGIGVTFDGAGILRGRYVYTSRSALHGWVVSYEHDAGSQWVLRGRTRISEREIRGRMYFVVDPAWTPVPWITVKPSVAMSTGTGLDPQWRCALEQSFEPFERTLGTVRVGIPLGEMVQEAVDAVVSFRIIL